ncbi:MAG: LysR family transcriptional regulator [Desulfuromonadaceae bacterium]|nr:LysR family transcriptional regulator [Desulfuromonadaceae bacterium]
METQYLKTLLIAAEEGSFSRAAERLHLTQSAVSQRTKNLEVCCGMQLLDRSGSILVPTAAGQVVLEGARKILQLEEEMGHALRHLQERRCLSICCTPPFGLAYLPQLIKQVVPHQSERDDLQFVFNTPLEGLAGLRSGSFDVVILEHVADLDFSAMQQESLPEEEMVWVSAPCLGLDAGNVSLRALLEQCVLTRRKGTCCHDLLCANLKRAGEKLGRFRRVVVLDDYSLLVREVMAGDGVAFVSRAVVESYLAQGSLVAHTVKGFVTTLQRSLVTRTCDPSPLQRMFVEGVRNYFYPDSSRSCA